MQFIGMNDAYYWWIDEQEDNEIGGSYFFSFVFWKFLRKKLTGIKASLRTIQKWSREILKKRENSQIFSSKEK